MQFDKQATKPSALEKMLLKKLRRSKRAKWMVD